MTQMISELERLRAELAAAHELVTHIKTYELPITKTPMMSIRVGDAYIAFYSDELNENPFLEALRKLCLTVNESEGER